MTHLWRGVIQEYADRLPSLAGAPVVTLGEGGTPLIPAAYLSSLVGAEVFVKYEGVNPTGSFKDRGKLSQAIAHGATLLQVDGNFDDCLTLARKLAEAYPIELVNSVNPARIEGQKTASFEIVDVLGDAPDIHCLPVGNAGNITAYWRGYREYHRDSEKPGPATQLPRMWGFQAEGAAPIVKGHPIDHPETIATAIRIGNPASWRQAVEARDDSGGLIDAVSDAQILAAHRLLSAKEGIFVEPASAASVAGLLAAHAAGLVPPGARIVCTVTGHGLKDPAWALKSLDGVEHVPTRVPLDAFTAATALGLEG